ncbi:S8 family peptidase [Gorillibacterium sp. sgz5001074]|uniref:S8 family peptidase n=1 Tax=Gorillibacterium sp. sgz5001074 TaxID=3446695 RepID=UPI003F664281
MSALKQVLSDLLGGGTGGNRVDRVGKSKGKRPPAASTVRKIIILKNAHCYRHCLKQLEALGVKPEKKVSGVHAVVCRFPAQADFKALESHAMVKRVENDHTFSIHVLPSRRQVSVSAPCASVKKPQIVPWGVGRIGAPGIWSKLQGGAIRVAVLDTGVSGTHPDLKVVKVYNTIAGKPSYDQNGHGTHVAGTIAALKNKFGVVGVAPRVRIYAVKAFDKSGNGFTSDIVQGLAWCIKNKMHVINMSFGMEEDSATVAEQIKRAHAKGIVLVASAGNNGTGSGTIDFPARMEEVIAVAASTPDDGVADFSSRGTGISVTAPGEGICSTIPGKSYTQMDGTSMAAPHVSGAAALLLAKRRTLTPDRIRQLLQTTATLLPGDTANDQGAGLIQAKEAFDQA